MWSQRGTKANTFIPNLKVVYSVKNGQSQDKVTKSRGGETGIAWPSWDPPGSEKGRELSQSKESQNLSSGLHQPNRGSPLSGDKAKGVPATSKGKFPLKKSQHKQ